MAPQAFRQEGSLSFPYLFSVSLCLPPRLAFRRQHDQQVLLNSLSQIKTISKPGGGTDKALPGGGYNCKGLEVLLLGFELSISE